MSNPIPRRAALLGAAAAAGPRAARARQQTIRIGVLTALTGAYADAAGQGSVVATRLAVDDFIAARQPDFAIDVIAGDILDKPDIGLAVARRWFDDQDVDAIVDVPNSAVALAVATLIRDRNKVGLFSGPGLAALAGSACGPNHLLWTWDTWAMANCTGRAVLAEGGLSWFFIGADYVFGRGLVADATQVVRGSGGTVAGATYFPFPDTTDYAGFLLQAQASGAKVIGLAASGSNFANLVKQAAEFGIARSGQRLAALLCLITNVHAIGLRDAQGLVLTEPFYWDLNDATRAFSARFAPLYRDLKPSIAHAGAYSATWHYLNSVAAVGAAVGRSDGRAVIAQMKRGPAEDPLLGRSTVRANGSVIHDMHLFQVKAPAELRYPWDYYRLVRTIPAEQAFRPLADSGCDLRGF